MDGITCLAPRPVLEPMGQALPEYTLADYAALTAGDLLDMAELAAERLCDAAGGGAGGGQVERGAAPGEGLRLRRRLTGRDAGRPAREDGVGGDGGGDVAAPRARGALGRRCAALLRAIRLLLENPLAEMRLDDAEHLVLMGRLLADLAMALLVIDSLSSGHTRDENSGETGVIVKALARLAQEDTMLHCA